MSDLLSGLEAFGLSGVDSSKLYEDKKEVKRVREKKVESISEEDTLFDKSYTCPICESVFKAKTVKVGRTRVKRSDLDLRPVYDGTDALKYDAVMCPKCGYSALTRYFKEVTALQKKLIKEGICQNYHIAEPTEALEMYTYAEAISRHKMALANAIVKNAQASEKGYICLKTAWLYRGKLENTPEDDPDYEKIKEECEKNEQDFLKNAYDGLLHARGTEIPPICGMDEPTFDYVLAVNAVRFGFNDVATKLISGILLSPIANGRIKDKARDLKDILIEKIKKENKKDK